MKELLLAGCAALTLVSSASAQNVAFNKPVSLISGSLGDGGAALPTLTDGVFRPQNTLWQDGTIWWYGTETMLEIDLLGTFDLTQAIVQADDNDAYQLFAFNPDTNAWSLMWDVANYDAFPYGMQTRPNPTDDAERYTLSGTFHASKLRIAVNPNDTDSSCSVSEVQVFEVPAPGAAGLLAVAGAGLLARRRR